MSKNEDIAIRSIAKRIREEGFDAIQDLMDRSIKGHLDDRLPEGEPYICPTCRQNAPIVFESLERIELKGRHYWTLAVSRHSAEPRPDKIAFSFFVVGQCENCGAITTFNAHHESAPVLAGMANLIFRTLTWLELEKGVADA